MRFETIMALSLVGCAFALAGAGYVCRTNTAFPALVALFAAAVVYL